MDCSHCGFPIHGSASGLRHYGTHIAHQENECLRLLMADRDRLRAEVEALKAENERQFTALNDWLYANGPNGWIDLLRHELAAMTTEVEALRADAALKRDLLLWALYHAQGGSSRVGQAIRRHLGIEQHARLTPEQIKDAERAAQEGRG